MRFLEGPFVLLDLQAGKMKIFTVGMDEKPSIKDNPVSPDGITLASTPIITLEKKRTSYKNYLMCLGTIFFILLSAIIVSKLVYYRIPDDLGLPWFELKHRIGVECDDCMSARIIQSFYPQRSSRVFENSNNAAPSAALAMQAGQPQTSGQSASATLTSQRSESGSLIDQPQTTDSRLDFLRKIISEIKEQAEKSGIEGFMQVKVLQVEPKQLFDGSDESQLQPVISPQQPNDLMRSFRPGLLSDLLRWNAVDNHVSRTLGNQFFGPPQDDMAKGEPMFVLGPFLEPQRLQLLPAVWDNNNNMAWSDSSQSRLFDLAQQISKQSQWNNPWQWPIPTYNKNNNEKVNQWQSIQWSNNRPPIPVMQQNFVPTWENNNQWQNNVQIGGNWQNSIQSEADNQWAQNGWQGPGRQQQLLSQYPQTWQASNWNIQRANIMDNLDEKMTQVVLPNDNINNYIYNNNGNDQWMRYYSQHINNQRLRQQPIANTVVSQSLEVRGPVLPQQTQDQSPGQQPQITDSLQSQMVLNHQVKSLSISAQQQEQQPQVVLPQINTVPEEAFHQSPSIPVVRSGPDDSVPRTLAPFVFNSDHWERTENPNLLDGPIIDNQEQLHLLHRERLQLPIHPIESDPSGSSIDLKMIDDDLNKTYQQSKPANDISRGLSNSVLFQVDEPPPQSVSMNESLA
ncbi:hypothetical protein LOAG_18367 [Loa loa]|uniref:SEA domain-containing protein n=1 Tax=Loa loa TaxID=7209 RepID=A0A1I7VWL6_LOALO|nr:hypothetical protein LOAG_18367 [Loa loa]EJD74304.1 hypothetical protein LOAG_18367 [Loa loa]